ncbi:hypothetical protein FF36_05988 [Frankia torreyi]|uniref:Uncharacterized protein n=1 Tax=Frankia torreyi TaxID=1856 RepID=A0A0D8B640_9ACTN|nr:hypothetical protein [Frankia torreyi]KJE19733.1 hypothetical protein FF36_05988 [Frankia torreyi]
MSTGLTVALIALSLLAAGALAGLAGVLAAVLRRAAGASFYAALLTGGGAALAVFVALVGVAGVVVAGCGL